MAEYCATSHPFRLRFRLRYVIAQLRIHSINSAKGVISPIIQLRATTIAYLAPWPNGKGIGLRSQGLQVRVLPGSFDCISFHALRPAAGKSHAALRLERAGFSVGFARIMTLQWFGFTLFASSTVPL